MGKYEIKDGKIARLNPFCLRCGAGVFMADRGISWSCGKCGDRYTKSEFKQRLHTPAKQGERTKSEGI